MAAACLLVSLVGILVIDNDINAVNLARQRKLATKRELEAVEECKVFGESYDSYYGMVESDETKCNDGVETGSLSDAWYYRSVNCYDS